MSVRRVICVLAVLLLSAFARPAAGSTVRYRTDAELVQLSERVVHARAIAQRSERPVPDGPIYTVTTLAVLEDLTGVPGTTLEVWEMGGVFGNEFMFVGGAVTYRAGEEVLVCLERGPMGLRSVAMGFSKFTVAPVSRAAAPDGLLARNTGDVLLLGGAVPARERTLAEFRELAAQVRGVRSVQNPGAVTMQPGPVSGFTFLDFGNGLGVRWFEPDQGTPLNWYQNSTAPNPLLSGDAVAEIQTSLAAWTNPTTASIILQYAGTTNQADADGPWSGIPANSSVISWEDPIGNISGSTLARGGGFGFLNCGTVNGTAYNCFTRGYVLFQNAADLSSSFRQTLNFTRVLTHEIGHAIGFGHSDVNPTSNIMNSSCCASTIPTPPALGPDDLNGLNTVYPSGSTPAPTCTFSLSPTSATPAAAGGAAAVSVTASASTCAWTATVGTASFATITAGSSGIGSGTVSYTVAANTTTSSRSGTLAIAGQTFTITQSPGGNLPSMAINRSALNFGAIPTATALAFQTPAQTVRITQTGTQNTVTWTAASNVPWLTVSPASGTGAATLSIAVQFASTLGVPPVSTTFTNTGTVTVTYTGAATATSAITATLRLPGTPAPPAGVVDTPVGGATGLQGSVAVSGWALDDVGIERVEIWRDLLPGETTTPFSAPGDPRHGKVFISNATFVDGARPDVEAISPASPFNYRAGWGYLMLTWGLFNQGNGTYTLSVFAFDKEAKIATLGQKIIGVNNQAANKPFGSIDTPAIGGTASGTTVNFGWGITPKVNGVATCRIQPTGAQVSIDSGPLQPVNFGANRTDIAAAFPGFSNTDSAGGSFVFDTTALANGVHSIGWLITDDCGRAEGIGSRFFTVQNGSQISNENPVVAAFRRNTESDEPVLASRGYGGLPVRVGRDAAGERRVRIAPGERIELRLPREYARAYQLVNGERRDLPIGSSWDAASQTFSWQPAPGFLGEFVLVFVRDGEQIRVLVEIPPA
jgi:hypothetical protein